MWKKKVDDKKAVHIIRLLLASPEASAILSVNKNAVKPIQTPKKRTAFQRL
jgi:hypothetical protein